MNGKFIVLEGLDGAGTTTQSKTLVDRIQTLQRRVALASEPSGPIEKIVRETIHDEDNGWPLLWYFAACRAYNLTKMEALLVKNVDVVCDRYRLSSMAYQSMDHDIRYVWDVNKAFRTPDVTFFLKVPVSMCLDRLASRQKRDPFETEQVLTRASAAYDEAIAIEREHGAIIHVIDGSLPSHEVADLIWQRVRELLEGG
jgi:dTMP kinase